LVFGTQITAMAEAEFTECWSSYTVLTVE